MEEKEYTNIETALKQETKKWLLRLENETKNIHPKNTKDVKSSIKNMHAYIKDCKYFLEIGDLIRAFEAIVYAWGIFETLLTLKLIEKK